MFTKGVSYDVISKRGVRTATIKCVTDKDVDLLCRLNLIAKVEAVKPLVQFAHYGR